MIGKKGKHTDYAGVPAGVVKVKDIGPWAVFYSEAETSVYFRSPACGSTVLRLSMDDMLMLAQEMETWRRIGKKADAGAPGKKNVRPSGRSRDKRLFKRFTRRCEVEFSSLGFSNRGIASDFSINGLFIETNYPFGAGTVVDIMVHLPDGSVSSLQGKVKRAMKTSPERANGMQATQHKNGMGIEFVRKDANYLHFIRSLLE